MFKSALISLIISLFCLYLCLLLFQFHSVHHSCLCFQHLLTVLKFSRLWQAIFPLHAHLAISFQFCSHWKNNNNPQNHQILFLLSFLMEYCHIRTWRCHALFLIGLFCFCWCLSGSNFLMLSLISLFNNVAFLFL